MHSWPSWTTEENQNLVLIHTGHLSAQQPPRLPMTAVAMHSTELTSPESWLSSEVSVSAVWASRLRKGLSNHMEDKATSEYTYKLLVEAFVYFTIQIHIHCSVVIEQKLLWYPRCYVILWVDCNRRKKVKTCTAFNCGTPLDCGGGSFHHSLCYLFPFFFKGFQPFFNTLHLLLELLLQVHCFLPVV